MTETDHRIPVTILSGFLGAGKTTLLNKLISNNRHLKLAVIENEFGEIPIDNDLVQKLDEGVFEMSNGCICCTLNDDLVEVLQKILNTGKKTDHLIVETTGVADPGPVAMTFISDQMVQQFFRLNAIVTLADVRYIENQLETLDEACRQVVAADLVVINKTDQVEKYQAETASNIIRKMNPHSAIAFGHSGEFEGVDFLNLNAFSQENLKSVFNRTEAKLDLRKSDSAGITKNVLKFKPTFQQKHSEIRSFSFEFPEPLDILKFDIWARYLLNENRGKLYRVKGILNFQKLEDKIVFQAVNDSYTTTGGGLWQNEERKSGIVFIGKNLDGEYLRKGLAACSEMTVFNPEEFFKAIS